MFTNKNKVLKDDLNISIKNHENEVITLNKK